MSEQRETIQESDAIEAWHFLSEDRRLQYGDRGLVKPRQKIRVAPPLELCRRGLHASIRAIDALQYAPGPAICRVKVWGEVIRGADKLCGEYRSVSWMSDGTEVLHRFGCDVATEALDLVESKGEKVDPRSRDAILVKLKWLHGETTDEELDAARDSAWAAATSAARAAAWAAARAAAWAAAWDSAWAAARAAARAAAWEDAARAAAWEDAARAAARAAAWDSARAAQNRRLESMFMDLQSRSKKAEA